jgi:hypothetical protein
MTGVGIGPVALTADETAVLRDAVVNALEEIKMGKEFPPDSQETIFGGCDLEDFPLYRERLERCIDEQTRAARVLEGAERSEIAPGLIDDHLLLMLARQEEAMRLCEEPDRIDLATLRQLKARLDAMRGAS